MSVTIIKNWRLEKCDKTWILWCNSTEKNCIPHVYHYWKILATKDYIDLLNGAIEIDKNIKDGCISSRKKDIYAFVKQEANAIMSIKEAIK